MLGIQFTPIISIGDIIKSAMIAAAFFAWGVTVETRFTENEGVLKNQAFKILVLEKRMDRTDQRMDQTVQEIKSALIRIEDKIDKR